MILKNTDIKLSTIFLIIDEILYITPLELMDEVNFLMKDVEEKDRLGNLRYAGEIITKMNISSNIVIDVKNILLVAKEEA